MFYDFDKHGNPIPCSAWTAEVMFRHSKSRCVARTMIGKSLVSTMFLCIDHNLGMSGSPVLWETMAFADDGSERYQRRYSNLDDAITGHRIVVEFMKLERKERDEGKV